MSNGTQDKNGTSRRGFLGLATITAVLLSFSAALAGALRLFKPDVYYEESRKFKIGTPNNYPIGQVKKIEDKRVFIFSENDGFHVISAVCTHLGCIVSLSENGFQCPCHGSKYDSEGRVIAGPAPRPLPWFEITESLDGTLTVDAAKEVKRGTRFKVKA